MFSRPGCVISSILSEKMPLTNVLAGMLLQ